MGDGNDQDLRLIVLIARGQNNGARPIFDAFLAPFTMFAEPEIRISDDQAGFRRG